MYRGCTQRQEWLLVMRLVWCSQLFYHLQREGSFPEPRAGFYAAEMALALGYLHSLAIVYRYQLLLGSIAITTAVF